MICVCSSVGAVAFGAIVVVAGFVVGLVVRLRLVLRHIMVTRPICDDVFGF